LSKNQIIHFNVWVILVKSHNVLLSCPQLQNCIVMFFYNLYLIALLLLLAMIWNFFSEASNLHCIFLYSHTIQRLNALASRRPHSFFGSINFKAEILISFFLFKSLKHLISLFLSNIWYGRKKSQHCVVSSKVRNLVQSNYTNVIKISDCLWVILILFIY
jgi:hypothetical protein